MATRKPTIIEAMSDRALFAPWFSQRWLRKDTWSAWRVFLKALYGLRMEAEEFAIYRKHTGRSSPPLKAFQKAWLICGRRSGKSRVAALIATYNAVFREYPTLQRGEVGVIPVIASDRAQAGVIFAYIANFFREIPMLSKLVVSQTKDSLELSNGIRIEVHTSDYRSVRGYTMVGGICDEVAFWPTDEQSASPDTEILNAIEKGSANIPDAMLLGVSSPYARQGALFEAHEKNFGKDTDELVWVGATREMNPTISQRIIDRAYEKDPAAASAEYGAQFRGDLANFLTPEAITACVMAGCLELPPRSEELYTAFCDPSGGASDSMTLAIAHAELDRAVLDVLRIVPPPFAPSSVVAEFCAELRRYGLATVTGDYYAAEWVREQFEKAGVTYIRSEKPKSDIYLSFLPAVNSCQVRLLDHPRLIAQLGGLIRRTRSGGKDSVDHRAGAHDDVANAAAGALVLVLVNGGYELGVVGWLKAGAPGGDPSTATATETPPALKPEPVAIACPSCQSTAISILAGGEARCAPCGKQWWPSGAPEASRVGFKNLATVAKPSMNSNAFQQARARFFGGNR